MAGRVPNQQPQNFYSALQLDGDAQIRLMKILSTQSGPIQCELRVVSFKDALKYVAVSYTWGPSTIEEKKRLPPVTSEPTELILCNGHNVLVTKNLHGFLVRARESLVKGSEENFIPCEEFWVDIVCIDQSNKDERSRQVDLMWKTFSTAKLVMVWLGEEDEATERAFNMIQLIGRSCAACLEEVTPRGIGSEAMLSILAPYGDLYSWQCLAKLFRRRYFTRAWIVQEVTLAPDLIACCGSYRMPWNYVVKASQFLTETAWRRWIHAEDQRFALNFCKSNFSIPNLLDATKPSRWQDTKQAMLYSLVRSRRFEASDPRDKIYVLLGVVGDGVRGKDYFAPIYGERSTEDTYTLAAIQMLKDSDDLLLLAQAEGDKCRNLSSLPSWVPDWSCRRTLGLGVTGYARYSAAGQLNRWLQIHEDTRSLTVEGLKLDDIVIAGESKEGVLNAQPFPKWFSIIQQLPHQYEHANPAQPRCEAFWRTLVTDTASRAVVRPAPSDYEAAYAFWITSKLAKFSKFERISDDEETN